MEVKETDLVCKLALPPEFNTETLNHSALKRNQIGKVSQSKYAIPRPPAGTKSLLLMYCVRLVAEKKTTL